MELLNFGFPLPEPEFPEIPDEENEIPAELLIDAVVPEENVIRNQHEGFNVNGMEITQMQPESLRKKKSIICTFVTILVTTIQQSFKDQFGGE